jgi:hypothetical protein
VRCSLVAVGSLLLGLGFASFGVLTLGLSIQANLDARVSDLAS